MANAYIIKNILLKIIWNSVSILFKFKVTELGETYRPVIMLRLYLIINGLRFKYFEEYNRLDSATKLVSKLINISTFLSFSRYLLIFQYIS